MNATVWQLARLADCADPDTLTSAGAQFLQSVEGAYEDMRENEATADDVHEYADGAVPIYTHEVWATFADLAAWNEDPSELIGDQGDMTKGATVALYMIAERLLSALLGEDDQ